MANVPTTTDELGHTVAATPVRIVAGKSALDETGLHYVESIPITIVTGTAATRPIVQLSTLTTTSETGATIPVVPARIVAGPTTTDSAGRTVDVLQVRDIGAAPATLGTLTLSGSLQIGVAASGTIIGATAGSTITSNIPGITVNSAARTYSGTPTGSAGTISNGLTETLAGATNTPHDSAIAVAAAIGAPLSMAVRDSTIFDTQLQTISTVPNYNTTVGPDGNGWVAEMVFKGLSTGGTFDATKITMIVSDPGFDSAGNATTRYRIIKGGKLLRVQRWTTINTANTSIGNGLFTTATAQLPDAAAYPAVYASGSDVLVRFSLSEPLYSGTTIVSVSAAAGAYTGSLAASSVSATNNSTRAYPKPLFAWVNQPYCRVASSTLLVEGVAGSVQARYGQQVACIKYTATDGTTTTPAVVSAAPSLSTLSTIGMPFEVYAATLDLSTLANGTDCTVNARVYPWIGNSASVLDLSTDGVTLPSSQTQVLLPFTCDRLGTWGGAIAYVRQGIAFNYVSSGPFGGNTTVYGPANAFNGVATGNVFVSTAIANPYVGAQLPVAKVIREVRITPVAGNLSNAPANFAVEYSDDGAAWTQKAAFTSQTWPTAATRSFDLGTADTTSHAYWRVRRTDATTISMYIAEIDMATSVGGVTVARSTPALVAADAAAAPFPTIGAAVTGLAAFNLATTGRNSHAGSTIYLMDDGAGGAVAHTSSVASSATAGNCWTDIRPDPAAVGAVTLDAVASGTNQVSNKFRFTGGLVIRKNAASYVFVTANSTLGELAFDNVTFTASVSGVALGFANRVWAKNVTTTDTFTGSHGMVSGGTNYPMTVGCVLSSGPSGGLIFNRALIGNVIPNSYFAESVPSGSVDSNDGTVVFANKMLSCGGGSTLGYVEPIVRGMFIAQNLVERISTGVGMNIAADSATYAVNNVVECHNSIIGERCSRFYLDVDADAVGTSGTVKHNYGAFYNLWDDWNNKQDFFIGSASAGSGVPLGKCGAWEVAYHVNHRGNMSLYGSKQSAIPATAERYLGEVWLPTEEYNANANGTKPTFVSDKSFSGAGGGGGNYHISSGNAYVKGRIELITNPVTSAAESMGVLKYDLDGNLRRQDGTGAIGCYEAA